MNVVEAARLMARYAKEHHAGAFGAPLAKDINPAHLLVSGAPDSGCAAIARRLDRSATRNDWTGRRYFIPAGSMVCTTIARTPDQPAPSWLDTFDYTYAYAEDDVITARMTELRRPRIATRISASSEIITCWGPRGERTWSESPADRPTAAMLEGILAPAPWPETVRARVLDELASVQAWHDDYPFYSDGTWGAVNLRGFNPADPLWGVKPAEMPRKWNAEHPDARNMRCDWTTICDRLPTMRAMVESVRWWPQLERVRLMRMEGVAGGGRLARHTDVTDRSAGTRNGQICRFHIPLVTHPDIKMHTWELDGTHRETHLAPFQCWYLDQRKPHAVTNPTEVDRVHLVVDVLSSPDVRNRLENL